MAPSTLLQIAGAPLQPSALSASSLLIIDAQAEYRDGKLRLAGIDEALGELATLRALAREAGMPVFHIRQMAVPGRGLFEASLGAFLPEAEPDAGEAVIDKRFPSAFAGTTLDAALRATGRQELIIAGFMTHMCVSSTARAALELGWRCTVVAAATASRDLPGAAGGPVVPAATVHHTALAEIADRFSIVVPDVAALNLARAA